MSEHYHDAADMKLLKEMKKLAPADFDAWVGLDKIVGRDGAIPRKYRELLAIAVACTTQCPYCIEAHAKGARAAGASREEIVEASLIAAAERLRPVCDLCRNRLSRSRRALHGQPQHRTTYAEPALLARVAIVTTINAKLAELAERIEERQIQLCGFCGFSV